ncbi:MAG: hypothetical protein LLG97_08475 [Deltaproteobacteria bacterium]|nr:hypothetical protein [Deltaproteobacteria bacterium]
MRLIDAFNSSATSTSKTDFEENGRFFGTLGAKFFYHFSGRVGIGAFIQGTYYFSDFTDDVSGSQGGMPFSLGLRIKNFWDANLGMGLQFTAPHAVKMYIGPYFHYSEFKVTPSGNVSGLSLASGETVMRSDDDFGGFAGIEIPLAKGFRLNLEGQFRERLSTGLAVTYTY